MVGSDAWREEERSECSNNTSPPLLLVPLAYYGWIRIMKLFVKRDAHDRRRQRRPKSSRCQVTKRLMALFTNA
eukprot:scaffold3701_cov192-Alexandrium_tamarense.AAC.12